MKKMAPARKFLTFPRSMEPEVSGVLVVAEGGDDPVTVREITEAVQALFGIEAHKIKVMKMD